ALLNRVKPAAPSPDTLARAADWSKINAGRLHAVEQSVVENDQLIDLLRQNARQVQFNQYNLEVFLSIANLCRQNLRMLQGIARIDALLTSAHDDAQSGHPRHAVAALDKATQEAQDMLGERNRVLKETTAVWYKSWLPRVARANGRTFLPELDDVKDHLPDRTVGMEYLVYRELHLPLGEWADKIHTARNVYAKAHKLPASEGALPWDQVE
ncbi:MAG TPA: hypothetical protein VFC78_10570, partial [Tepidisphaeraceae bacterium]|nr:hypothetical protein [Tepidisphaeraceae bacterium]